MIEHSGGPIILAYQRATRNSATSLVTHFLFVLVIPNQLATKANFLAA